MRAFGIGDRSTPSQSRNLSFSAADNVRLGQVFVLLVAMNLGRGPDVGALLNAFVEELGRETRLLQQVVTLRTRKTDTDSRERIAPLLADVDAAVTRLEANVEVLRKYHRTRAAAVSADSAQTERHAKATRARIAAIRNQLPEELLLSLHQIETQQAVHSAPILDDRPPLAVVTSDHGGNISVSTKQNNGLRRALAAGCGSETGGIRKGNLRASAPLDAKKGGENKRGQNPDENGGLSRGEEAEVASSTIRCITQEDLDSAPSYVRGRLTVERSRGVVTALNKVLCAKYEFLAQNPKTLSADDVTRRQDMQEVDADCHEIAGRPFFTDADCKHYGVRFDAITKSVVNMLRHVSVLKEVRGKNKIRVFIVAT